MSVLAQLSENLQRIRNQIAEACASVNRTADEVTLIAVTKYAEWEWVEGLIQLGCRSLGEARPQQLIQRAAIAENDIEWHLIGHLQRNKVRSVLPICHRIHSVDSLRLAKRIDLLAGEMQLTPSVLLEVNIAGEAQKDGWTPSALAEEYSELKALQNIQLAGLMGMAPHTDDEDRVRSVFRQLAQLRDELKASSERERDLPELSMGMSGDFRIAIEEGATHVRIGSALYEGLS